MLLKERLRRLSLVKDVRPSITTILLFWTLKSCKLTKPCRFYSFCIWFMSRLRLRIFLHLENITGVISRKRLSEMIKVRKLTQFSKPPFIAPILFIEMSKSISYLKCAKGFTTSISPRRSFLTSRWRVNSPSVAPNSRAWPNSQSDGSALASDLPL